MTKRILSFFLALVMVLTTLAIAPVPANAAALVSSQAFIDVLKDAEGFSATPYYDVNHYSIGYGNYCPDDMVDYYMKNPLSREEAEVLFKQQLGGFEKKVNDFAAKHGLTFKQHQFDALVSFTYNCGAAWMDELDGYFNVAVREGDMGAGIMYGMMMWFSAGGKPILINRRMRELNMYRNGVYTTAEGEGSYPASFRWVYLDGGAGKVTYRICGFDSDLKAPLNLQFTTIPTGKDQNGRPFAYTLAGWYTAGGRKVELLDDRLTRGETLYARWADPQGNIVTPPAQTEPPATAFPKTATVTADTLRVRTGPGTTYGKDGSYNKGDKLTVLAEVEGGTYKDNGQTYTTWCKIGENRYVAKHYVEYADNPVTGLQLVSLPTVTEYVQPVVSPKLEGAVLLVTYANGHSEALTPTKKMVSGFDGSKTGKQTVTITHKGKTVNLDVTVSAPTPPVPDNITSGVFQIAEGTITGVAPGTTVAQLLEGINERQYVTVCRGPEPMKPEDVVGTDTMVMLMDGENIKALCTVVIHGDVTGDGAIDGKDATLLLQHAAGWDVPVNPLAGDMDKNGEVDGKDATLLLQYAAGWEVT